jgi:hypothetical protein
MVLALENLKKATSAIFENDDGMIKGIVLPEPPILMKDKLLALEEGKLSKHRSSCIFDMRCWQAKELGFQQLESGEMVRMLMGNPHTEEDEGAERQTYEWVYNHHTDTEMTSDGWGGKPTIFKRIVRAGLWYAPPFSKTKVWSCQFGKLDYLKREIPYGVVLRINESKQLKLFNCFNVIAPQEAWERKTDIDPIVVATIWELPPVEEKKNKTVGQVAHFFLAQW